MKTAQPTAQQPTQRASIMKSAQLIAVLVLALMVGGLAFVSVYLGSGSPINEPTPTALPSLNFPIKNFPREGEKVLNTEVHQGGYQDYWFVNDSDRDVAVGLNGKGCTCTEVEVTVAPPSWTPYLARSAVLVALQQPLRGLHNLTVLAAACERDYQFPELPQAETTMLTKEFSTKAPAGAVGRIRLTWRQEVAKPLVTSADLWMGQSGSASNAHLEAKIIISDALNVNKEVTIPAISERELEKKKQTKPAWIVCFSLTRHSFPLKAELLHNRIQPGSDPIEVGEPIPLSASDLRFLEETQKKLPGLHALSGYRIPVRVRAQAKDGTPMEWGRFYRIVQLSSTDAGIDPVQVQVTGDVLGDISISGAEEMGTINMGPFPRSRGCHREIVLETDESGLDVELDPKHMPNYLKATLGAVKETAAGHRSWVLRVEVPPGKAVGSFPSANNPEYRDSAIYVKTRRGKSATSLRSIRIPVRGEARD